MTATGVRPAGTFRPAPGANRLRAMVAAVAATELRTTLRNGEQLLLTLVIPVLLLVLFASVELVDLPGEDRVAFLVPGVLALAIMSTAFTSTAIGTAFERRYGVLKRLGATPLPRWGLLAGKTLCIAGVLLVQSFVVAAVGVLLGWRPVVSAADVVAVAALVVLGTAAFAGLAFLMAGTLRAEAVLAGANLVYLLLLVVGGVIVPITVFPPAVTQALEWLPITALSEGLRVVLATEAAVPAQVWVALALWSAGGLAAAARLFRWE